MVKYMVIHTKHEGCYDTVLYNKRGPMVTINTPKVYLFDDHHQASLFFEEYITDIDVPDERCKKGNDIEHIDWCTCGIVNLDDDGNPVLFYNKTHQIFFIESQCDLYTASTNSHIDINNINVTHKHIYKSMHKKLLREQKLRYIELGQLCQEYLEDDTETVS